MDTNANAMLRLMLDHFNLLLERSDEIRRDRRWFMSEVGEVRLALLGGGGPLSIGMLLELWEDDAMRAVAACGHRAHVVGLGGSALSGDFSARGICHECRTIVSGRRGPAWPGLSFGDLWPAAMDARQRNPNQLETEPGERARFDWSAGVVGARAPDTVVRAPVDAIPFPVLVDVLRGGPGDAHVLALDGSAVATFRWSTGELIDADGAVVRRLDEGVVRDGEGRTVFTWDGLYLRDGAPLPRYEIRRRVTRGPATEGGALVVASLVPLEAGDTLDVYDEITEWAGGVVTTVHADRTVRDRGVVRWRIDAGVPTRALLALSASPAAP